MAISVNPGLWEVLGQAAEGSVPLPMQSTPMGQQVFTAVRSPTAQETSEGEPTGKHTSLHTYTRTCTHTFHGGKSQEN